MLTCVDVKFIFDSVRLGLSSSANILQIADVAPSCLRVVFVMFLAITSPNSSCSSYTCQLSRLRVENFDLTPAHACGPISHA